MWLTVTHVDRKARVLCPGAQLTLPLIKQSHVDNYEESRALLCELEACKEGSCLNRFAKSHLICKDTAEPFTVKVPHPHHPLPLIAIKPLIDTPRQLHLCAPDMQRADVSQRGPLIGCFRWQGRAPRGGTVHELSCNDLVLIIRACTWHCHQLILHLHVCLLEVSLFVGIVLDFLDHAHAWKLPHTRVFFDRHVQLRKLRCTRVFLDRDVWRRCLVLAGFFPFLIFLLILLFIFLGYRCGDLFVHRH
mmetsp:Transcript_31416/g.60697  ORF Transcript_31416/g.60697 Transcript_31416/m.60697 type:complete len:247 (-) Transcript_31416:638-1378(-)